MRRTTVLLAILAFVPGLADAHHFMGNELPRTFLHGLLSGLGHPIVGADHAVFILASGILLALVPHGLWGVLALLLGSLTGALLHLQGLVVSWAELAVAASVVMVGTLLLLRARIGLAFAGAIAFAAGALHGYVYAETIFGAETAPLTAYLLGFSAIQFVLATGAFGLHRLALRLRPAQASAGCTALGAAVVAIGAALLVGA